VLIPLFALCYKPFQNFAKWNLMGHMQTILDEAYSWFLEKIAYEGNLTLFLIEAGLGKSGSLDLGDILLE
jgi:hypothetical protein